MLPLLTLLILALTAVGGSLFLVWRQVHVRRSDRFIDELAAGLPPDGVDDETTRMLIAWRDDERRPWDVSTLYPSPRGGHEPNPR